ncbi:hypothetical protein SAMN05444955_102121 [Lihuaxuella thermophila]|uniref:Uncharacterized protein n=1 Tax=Lihuaxuella thermophila TaxID=1173111 RepID=A0A1H8BFN3_9BACL|nr:hypothetical protein SAMN05444955_102121 [Lihuaxuella thermophila]
MGRNVPGGGSPNEGRKRITCLSGSRFDPHPKCGTGAAGLLLLRQTQEHGGQQGRPTRMHKHRNKSCTTGFLKISACHILG